MASKSFCLLPWVSIAVRNNGDFRLCCNANTSAGRGLLRNERGETLNAADVPIETARNSALIQEVRRQMLAGEWPSSCQRCQAEELAGIRSKRQFTPDLLPSTYNEEWARRVTDDRGHLDIRRSPLLDLDVRFGNKCNLACRMCGPADSSAWRGDHEKLGEIYVPDRYDWYEAESFWNSLSENAPSLEHIYVVGGEPLLIDRHYEFLRMLVEQGHASRIVLEYNTNLTVLPDKALELWRSFKKVRVGVSTDGQGPFNDYIRYPSRFGVLEKNLRRLDEAPGNIQAWLACTVSVYNLHHLVDFMAWIKAQSFRRISRTTGKEFFVPHPVHSPGHLNIQALPKEDKVRYAKHLREQLSLFLNDSSLSAPETQRAQDIVAKYLRFMEERDLSQEWPRFLDYTRRLDQIRGQSFADLQPLIQFK